MSGTCAVLSYWQSVVYSAQWTAHSQRWEVLSGTSKILFRLIMRPRFSQLKLGTFLSLELHLPKSLNLLINLLINKKRII